MKRFITKKRVLAGGAAVVTAAGLTTAAFAFFTTTGSGTGTGAVGTAGSWSVSGVTLGTGPIYPGQGSEAVQSAVVQNPTGHGAQGLHKLVVQITSVAETANAATNFPTQTACAISDFQLTSTGSYVLSNTAFTNDTGTYTLLSTADIAPGDFYVSGTGDSATTGNALPSGLALTMYDNGAAQDRCQGATVTLTLTAS